MYMYVLIYMIYVLCVFICIYLNYSVCLFVYMPVCSATCLSNWFILRLSDCLSVCFTIQLPREFHWCSSYSTGGSSVLLSDGSESPMCIMGDLVWTSFPELNLSSFAISFLFWRIKNNKKESI